MDTMTTVSEVLNKLKKEGYTTDFNLESNCLICNGNALKIHPEEFVVDRHFRFEGISDPGDEAIVYAISSAKHNVKGVLVNGYGIYSNEMSDDMMKVLSDNQNIAEAENTALPEKSNEATPQRPQGDRLLDAQLVEMNLPEFILQIKQEEAWQKSDRNAITIYKSKSMRLVLIALHQGAEMKTHTAPGVISVQVLEGQLRFTTEQQVAELSKGQMLALEKGIPHSVSATEEVVFLLTLAIEKPD